MKKSLSLLLALVLTLSITAFATPSTELYFARIFDDYNSINEFVSEFESTTYTPSHGSMSAATGEMLVNAAAVQDVEGATGGLYSVGGNSFSAANMSLEKNALGRTTFRSATTSLAYGSEAGLIVIPKKSWNFVENPDEIFVISYDLEVNGRGTKVEKYHGDQTYWSNPEKTTSLPVNAFWRTSNTSGNVQYGANAGRVFSSGAMNYTFTKDTVYRIAYGYSYENGNEYTDNYNAATLGQTYYAPTRYYFRDGGYWTATGNKYKSTESFGQATVNGNAVPSHSWNGKPVLYAFTLTWAGEYGIEYGDLIAYTVSTDPNTFTAEMVDDTVELGDSAVVKFSQPIVPSLATKDAFTMTEGGNPFTSYEIGEVKTFIDEATGEVGSTVEFIFPYGQKADTVYGINLNTTGTMIKSEIMRTVASGNNLTFTTGSAPANIVTLSATNGLSGDGDAVTSITSSQAKFTAVATASDKPTFLFVGIYDSLDNLVSYTYSQASTGDMISLASKVEAGYKVKAFSCGSVYDLSQVFGTGADIH